VPRWTSVVIPVLAFLMLGVALPIGVLVWLLVHHEPPYVLDRESMGSARRALGGHPVAMKPVSGVLDVIGDGGTTADYADGSSATIVRAARPSQVIEKYGSSLDERGSSSFTVGGFTQRDARLPQGRFMRAIGTDNTVFVFNASSVPALDQLTEQSAVRRNTRRDIGNTVLDDHAALASLIGLGWFVATLVLAGIAVARAALAINATVPNRSEPFVLR
jgi:hypothetical protein